MKIQITAQQRTGLPGMWTLDTLWPSDAPTSVEVIDDDASPPRAKGKAFDGMKIGRAELAILRSLPGIIVAGVDQTNAVEMTAQLAEANKRHADECARLQGIIDEQGREILRLKPYEATAREQEGTIASLRNRLQKATKVETTPAVPVA